MALLDALLYPASTTDPLAEWWAAVLGGSVTMTSAEARGVGETASAPAPAPGQSLTESDPAAAQALADVLGGPIGVVANTALANFAGPLGFLAVPALQAALTAEGFPAGQQANPVTTAQGLVDAISAAMGLGPTVAPVDITDALSGPVVSPVDVTDALSGPAPSAAVDSDPGLFHRGGVIRDRRAGDEVIRAEAGEFVVRRAPARKHRKLLERLNAGATRAALREALG